MRPEQIQSCLGYDAETGAFVWKTGRRRGRSAGCVASNGYVVVRIEGRTYMGHRLAWLLSHGEWPAEIDHRNRNRADNRLANLRLATRAQNNVNRDVRRDSVTGVKGVQWHAQTGKWRARIKVDKKSRSLGLFPSIAQAAAAYSNACKVHYGEFAS